MQGKREKQQQFAAASTTQAGSFCFCQTSMRMPETFDGSFKIGEDPQQKVLIFASQLNAYFWQQRCLEAVESLTEFGAELVDQAYRA